MKRRVYNYGTDMSGNCVDIWNLPNGRIRHYDDIYCVVGFLVVSAISDVSQQTLKYREMKSEKRIQNNCWISQQVSVNQGVT